MSTRPENEWPVAGHSVSRLLPDLKAGDVKAVGELWRRYAQPLVEQARRQLTGAPTRAGDEDDVAVDAFVAFCQGATRPDRFPDLENRQQLWKLLATITIRRAFDFRRRSIRQHERERGLSALGEAGLDGCPGSEPDPAFASRVADLLELLPEDLREVARLRMEGHSNEQIAFLRGCSVKTVERWLKLIRGRWRAQIEEK
jgi:DNA-directed RNA polymerase specialized sigma24 family protein